MLPKFGAYCETIFDLFTFSYSADFGISGILQELDFFLNKLEARIEGDLRAAAEGVEEDVCKSGPFFAGCGSATVIGCTQVNDFVTQFAKFITMHKRIGPPKPLGFV